MRSLYNILFALFFCVSAPYYFLKMWRRGNWRRGFRQRFGQYDAKFKQALTNRHSLWLHAVSVGEVNVCTGLIQALEPRLPNIKFVVSTTTSTGMERLRGQLPADVEKIYYPIDHKKCVHRALSVIHPAAVVLVEAEIWPNFLWRARDRKIPLFLVNARMSERSYPRYRRFGFLFRELFASFVGVGAQNEADASRLIELGCRPEAVHIVGSMKFDAVGRGDRRSLDVSKLLRQLGVPEGARVLLGASTHAGEEAILAEQFLRLRQRFPDLYLVLAPRHFERGRQVGRELDARGIKFVYRNQVTAATQFKPGEVPCLLVNTTGELSSFYEHATIVFVGKSLCGEGGQNPIEPAARGRPTVFGPRMQNFEAIAESFLRQQGAIQVRDAAALEQVLGDLLADERRREALGRNALRVVWENRGAIERTAEMIVKHLPAGELYVARPG
jgi:3-deoxy-D-manno-octulosonic-acid transferase